MKPLQVSVGKDDAALIDELLAPVRAPRDGRPFVIAQLGQSLDGRIATIHGESKYINRFAALDHLHRLRAAVDAVVVGVGTVITDDPQLTVRRVAGRSPARVVIDPRGRVPLTARCFAADGTPTFVIRAEPGPVPVGADEIVIADPAGAMAPVAMIAALAARGLHRILVEGGARTISAFIDAGCVDRLHVLVAPLILGSGKPGLDLSPPRTLATALRPSTRVVALADGDILFDCDLSVVASEPT